MTAKRANGEGSVSRRGDGKGWQGRYCYVDNGLVRRRYLYGRTRAEVLDKLRTALRGRDEGLPPPTGRETVAEFLRAWHASAAPSLRPTSAERYRGIIERHLAPTIGTVRLVDLRPEHVARTYAGLLAAGQAPKSVQLVHTVLHRALRQAVRWGKVPRNVSDLVDEPRVPHREAPTLLPSELARLRSTVRGHRLEALFVVAMLTGMRRGELLALRWSAVDLEDRRLHVRTTMQRMAGGSTAAEPKSRSSRRSIALGPDAVAVLGSHRARLSRARLAAANVWVGEPDGLVFPNDVGGSLAPTTLTREWARILAAAGLAPVSFHTLRHAATTLTVSANIAPKVAARRLGHASATITLDRYSHVPDELERAAAAAVEAVVRAAGGEPEQARTAGSAER